MADNRKTIGQLNGRWAILLKIALAAFPVMVTFHITWAIWITSETFVNRQFRLKGDRVTPLELAEAKSEIYATIADLPPQDWQERIRRLEQETREVKLNQAKILTILERLEKK